MAPRAVYFVVIIYIAAAVATADHSPVPDTSDDRLELELWGHAPARCSLRSHPRAAAAAAGASARFTLLQKTADGRGVRGAYFCSLAAGGGALARLAQDSVLAVRRENLTDGEPVLELGRVQCVLQPDNGVPAGLFDFRATRLSADLPPFLCLHLDAARGLAAPDRGALVFRFNRGSVPDLVCTSFSDVPLEESDIQVVIFGFLHPASGPLNCHFRTVSEVLGQPAAELLTRVSDEIRAQLVRRPDLPATLLLPNFACDAVRQANQTTPSSDDLTSSLLSSSASLQSTAFTVTGPSGRWVLCWTSLE